MCHFFSFFNTFWPPIDINSVLTLPVAEIFDVHWDSQAANPLLTFLYDSNLCRPKIGVTTILSPTPSGTEKSNKNEHKVIFELQMFSSGDFEICAKLHLSFVLSFLRCMEAWMNEYSYWDAYCLHVCNLENCQIELL